MMPLASLRILFNSLRISVTFLGIPLMSLRSPLISLGSPWGSLMSQLLALRIPCTCVHRTSLGFHIFAWDPVISFYGFFIILLRTPLIFLRKDSIDFLELPLVSFRVPSISLRGPWMCLRIQMSSLICPHVFQWFPAGFQWFSYGFHWLHHDYVGFLISLRNPLISLTIPCMY